MDVCVCWEVQLHCKLVHPMAIHPRTLSQMEVTWGFSTTAAEGELAVLGGQEANGTWPGSTVVWPAEPGQ